MRESKGFPIKKIYYRFDGKGAGSREQGERQFFEADKLDSLFSGSP
jgi:hypothetical protein